MPYEKDWKDELLIAQLKQAYEYMLPFLDYQIGVCVIPDIERDGHDAGL